MDDNIRQQINQLALKAAKCLTDAAKLVDDSDEGHEIMTLIADAKYGINDLITKTQG